jgi:lysophospholipase L1-like esterase
MLTFPILPRPLALPALRFSLGESSEPSARGARGSIAAFACLLAMASAPWSAEAAADTLPSICDATPVTVSIAGDSITNAYWSDFRDVSSPLIWDVSKVALGGLRAPQFNGEIDKAGVLHDYTQDLIDLEPEIAVLLLGTNDSLFDWSNPDHSAVFATYTNSMESILNRLEAAGITVILGIPTPLQPNTAKLTTGEYNLANYYRPWIESQAIARELQIIDFFDRFVTQPGWEEMFPDGVHPFTEDGAHMMGFDATNAACVQAVPEPGMTLSFAASALALVGLAARRR